MSSGKRGCARAIKGRTLKQLPDTNGYMRVNLYRDGHPKTTLVHRTVLRAFVSEPPPGFDGCHCNGKPTDNRLSNLRWDTRANNLKDMIRHGTSQRGEKNARAKLNTDDVREIRNLMSSGVKQTEIARRFGVSPPCIAAIKSGRKWGWLGE